MSDHSGGGGLSFATMIGYAVCALFVALVADIMQPMGPFVLYLAVVFVVVTVVCALLSFAPPLKGVMQAAARFALLSVLIYGAFYALQTFVAPKPLGERRGFVAAMIPPAQDLQRWILAEAKKREAPPAPVVLAPAAAPALPPEAPAAAALKRLQAAIAGSDPIERAAAASEALGAKDAAVVTAAADLLYRSGDGRLRLLAVRRLLALREGARLPLLATGEGDAAALAAALQAGGVTFKSVNETSGAVMGSVCGPAAMNGAINLANVILTGTCRIGRDSRSVTLVFTPADDFRLIGEATSEAGQKVRVELPLS
jgi:hypothetical protein